MAGNATVPVTLPIADFDGETGNTVCVLPALRKPHGRGRVVWGDIFCGDKLKRTKNREE
jgi:hypothetical protein